MAQTNYVSAEISGTLISCGSDSKEFACYAGNLALISGSARSPGERKDYTFKWASQVAQLFLPVEFHGQRSLGGLQSMGSSRAGHD